MNYNSFKKEYLAALNPIQAKSVNFEKPVFTVVVFYVCSKRLHVSKRSNRKTKQNKTKQTNKQTKGSNK